MAPENVKMLQILSKNELTANIMNISAAHVRSITDNILTFPYASLGLVLQHNCANSTDIINECAQQKCFSQRFFWLMYDEMEFSENSQTLGTSILQQLNATRLFIDAEITVVDLSMAQNLKDGKLQVPMLDVYNNGFSIGGKLNVTLDRFFIMTTSPESGKHLLSPSRLAAKRKYENRIDMSDVSLRVGTLYLMESNGTPSSDDIIKHLSSSNDAEDPLNRPIFQMALHIRDILKYNVTWVHHDIWNVNNSYGGLLGSIVEDRIDLPTGVLLYNSIRFEYLRPMFETFPLRSVFIFRTYGSQKQQLVVDVFLKPFNNSVWLCLMAIIVLISICLKCIFVYEEQINDVHLMYAPSWYLTMVTAMGAYCQQGAALVPSTIPGRCIFLILFITSMLVYNYYTTEVLSALIGNPVGTNIKTILQLSDSSLSIGIEKTTYTEAFLNITRTPDVLSLLQKKVWPFLNSSTLYVKPKVGLELARRGGYAYHCEASTAYVLIKQTYSPFELCDLNEIYLRQKLSMGYYLNLKSSYHEMFKTKFLRLRETGIASKYGRQWVPEKPQCTATSFVFSVGMEYTGALFVLLIIAMLISMLILTVEIFSFKLVKRKKFAHVAPRVLAIQTHCDNDVVTTIIS